MVIRIFTFSDGFCHKALKCRYGYHFFIFSTNQKLVYVPCMKHHTISPRSPLLTPFLIPIYPSFPLSYIFTSILFPILPLSPHPFTPVYSLSPISLPTIFPNSLTQLCSVTHPTLSSHPTFLLHSLTNLSPFFFLLFHSTLSHTHSPFLNLISSTHRSLFRHLLLYLTLSTLSLKTTLLQLEESIILLSRRLFLPHSNPFYSIFSFYFLIPLTQPRTPFLFTLSHISLSKITRNQ